MYEKTWELNQEFILNKCDVVLLCIIILGGMWLRIMLIIRDIMLSRKRCKSSGSRFIGNELITEIVIVLAATTCILTLILMLRM